MGDGSRRPPQQLEPVTKSIRPFDLARRPSIPIDIDHTRSRLRRLMK
jgi:hypothetical protein